MTACIFVNLTSIIASKHSNNSKNSDIKSKPPKYFQIIKIFINNVNIYTTIQNEGLSILQFFHNSNFLIIINLKIKNGHKSLKNKITLKMKKTIFLGNLTKFF